MKDNNFILEARNITKHYGGVCALSKVDLKLKKGEILGIVGDNGAGKSTLIKIISGVLSKDSGEIFFENKKVRINNPHDAMALGIRTVYQDLALVDTMDITSNIFLGKEILIGGFILNLRKMYKDSIDLMKSLNIDIDINNFKKRVEGYSGGQRQGVAISKVAYWGKKVIILDEPTAALGQKESKTVLGLIKNLEKKGVSIIIISHNLQHLFSIVDRVLILRRGNLIDVMDIHKTTSKEIVTMITGAEEYYERV